jgi:hypothetical protein
MKMKYIDPYSHRETDDPKPVTEVTLALELMCRWGRSLSRIHDRSNDRKEPRVYIETTTEPRHNGTPSISRYLLDPAVLKVMREKYYVAGTPKLGYTDDRELKVTDAGQVAYHRQVEAQKRLELEAAPTDPPPATKG